MQHEQTDIVRRGIVSVMLLLRDAPGSRGDVVMNLHVIQNLLGRFEGVSYGDIHRTIGAMVQDGLIDGEGHWIYLTEKARVKFATLIAGGAQAWNEELANHPSAYAPQRSSRSGCGATAVLIAAVLLFVVAVSIL